MIYEIFRLCDGTVWLEDWFDFQEAFEKIIKKHGLDLYPIYFGKSKKKWIAAKKKMYNKWIKDKEKGEKRHKKRIVYIKNRPHGRL